MIRTYSEMITFSSFYDRCRYLKLYDRIGYDTFGFDRIFNQKFYRSSEWKQIRDYVITRDNGNDLGIDDRPILSRILIHHMNPIALDDIKKSTDILLNPEYLISVSLSTHNAIHFGGVDNIDTYSFFERKPADTKLW